jgi:hypothetical protein
MSENGARLCCHLSYRALCIPGIHKEPVQNLNQLTSAKTVIATIDRLTDAKTGDGLLQLLGYGREIIIRVVVAWI